MKRMKLLLSVVLYIGLLSAFTQKAFAVTTPSFPSCVNPQGTLKVSYSQGTHGIPGDTATYNGSDSVYTLSDTTLTQCFCALDGSGIQTNWWKVSSLTDSEVQILRNQGWTYITDGSLWGLENAPYLTQNISFSCQGGVSGGIGGGEVLGASTGPTKAVLGLATTGNAVFILGVISLGTLMLIFGSILSLKRKK